MYPSPDPRADSFYYYNSYQVPSNHNGHPIGMELDAESQRDPDNDPPHSRVFVVCGKDTTEEQLLAAFSPFGKIEYCKVIQDKITKESKGLAYIKFSKSSEAAFSVEELNGKILSENTPALKVMVAEAKGTNKKMGKYESNHPEDNPPRSRLFFVCGRETTEEEMIEKFKQCGCSEHDLEYCKLMKDKHTGESKGCGYAKFTKSSTAALIMERMNDSEGAKMKVIIADPKGKRATEYDRMQQFPMNYPRGPIGFMPPYGYPMPDPGIPYSTGLPRQRLFVVVNKSVTQEQLGKLFGRFPGMEYCDLKKNKKTGESKGFAYVNYSTIQASQMAKEQLDGVEFPAGHTLKVIYAEPLGVNAVASPHSAHPHMQGREAPMPAMSHAPPMVPYAHPYHSSPATSGSPTDPGIFPEGSRLFIVLTGKLLPEYMLTDMFSPFGGLEYIRMQKDKNYGYVKYSTAMSAQMALRYYDGADYNGTKIKIQVALPPNNDSRKRQKT